MNFNDESSIIEISRLNVYLSCNNNTRKAEIGDAPSVFLPKRRSAQEAIKVSKVNSAIKNPTPTNYNNHNLTIQCLVYDSIC